METKKEIEFNKYKKRGSLHWREMISKDVRVFNAFQQARYDWILKLAGDVRGKKVLDLGCGDGSLTYILAKSGAEVIGIDNEELGLKYANENLESMNHHKNLKYTFVTASAYSLPFDSNSFDLVVSCDVIEHLNEPEKMCIETSRVLKDGGKFILTTPYKLTEFPQDINHVKEYYPNEMKTFLEVYFKNVEVKETHHLMWRMVYAHAFRFFGGRPLGRWLINIPSIIFGWNPFMIPYEKKTKFDAFSNICAWGNK